MLSHSVPALTHLPKPNPFLSLITEQFDLLKKQLESIDRKSPRGLIHDLRVLSRRLRASLDLAQELIPPSKVRRLRKKVERLTQTLGPVRSSDVAFGDLKKRLESAPDPVGEDLGFLIEKIRKERRKLKRRLPETIAKIKIGKTVKTFNLRGALSGLDTKKLEENLHEEILKASDRVYQGFRTFQRKGKIEDLHALRIDLKKWRYLCEMEEQISPNEGLSDRLKSAKLLQDRLGLIHDREALAETVKRRKITRLAKKCGSLKIFKTFLKDLKDEMKDEMEGFRREGENAIMELIHFNDSLKPSAAHDS